MGQKKRVITVRLSSELYGNLAEETKILKSQLGKKFSLNELCLRKLSVPLKSDIVDEDPSPDISDISSLSQEP